MKSIRTSFGILTITCGLAACGTTAQAQQPTSFVWTKLAGNTNLPSGWCSYPSSIDMSRGIIYSLSANGVFWKYDVRSNVFTQLPVSGWPGRVDQCIYNLDENTIWLSLNGRGQVFRLPVAGGTVTSVGASGASSEDFSNVTFWNPVTHKYGAAFGYGFGAVRNWRWEFGTTDSDWVQIEANTPGREPWTRSGPSATMDFNGQRLFIYGVLGNSTGNQGQFDPGFANNGNQFDFLKDLWVLNLQSNQWTKLIPLNTSIPIHGGIVYFPPLNMLLMINGAQIPTVVSVTGLWTFNVGQSTNWTQVVATGDIPDVADEAGRTDGGAGVLDNSFYDPFGNRILHFNNKGVYALNIGPVVSLIKAVKPSFSYLALGTNYQLQVSTDMKTWTNQGSTFTATNTSMVYPQYFDVDNWNRLFFRLQTAP
jgi:hypothetical protein